MQVDATPGARHHRRDAKAIAPDPDLGASRSIHSFSTSATASSPLSDPSPSSTAGMAGRRRHWVGTTATIWTPTSGNGPGRAPRPAPEPNVAVSGDHPRTSEPIALPSRTLVDPRRTMIVPDTASFRVLPSYWRCTAFAAPLPSCPTAVTTLRLARRAIAKSLPSGRPTTQLLHVPRVV